MDDLIAWLRATIESDLATARAATYGEWAMFGHGDDNYLPPPAYPGEQTTRGHGWNISLTAPGGLDVAAELRRADARHVIAQQPRQTIVRCEAELGLIAAYEDQARRWPPDTPYHADSDPIDLMECERSSALGEAVRLLARGYRHRPGWQEGWAP
ncbi:DUF6221 family protein [Microbispora sp. GKU 823]|uniref:DUF6221 family protein n=1 Tax=Microbispora sp. GKU 823 TaxID=1652100 RepID=UPI0009A3AA49|nr:DUF6221 family protein [Microbispora sp. GKU 823]OPG12526.1 hypothetical protein B1L11_14180 [Microbispora sp. GKU 823]